MTPTTPEAQKLALNGALTLAEIESAGVRVDKGYLDVAVAKMDRTIFAIKKRMEADKEVWPAWKRKFRDRANLGSRDQFAKVVFGILGHAATEKTEKGGRLKADKAALETVDLPFVRDFLWAEKLKKAQSTYLLGIRRELVERDGMWFVHPSYNLNTVASWRSSCVAKGTLIETVRDLSKHPNGKPIEQVKSGDYVYCYDNSLNLVIRRVIWAGKTGHKPVIRLHWSTHGRRGHLDVTGDHKIRLFDGSYVRAEELLSRKDFRPKWVSRKSPRVRCLAMARGRKKDRLFVSGQKDPVLDHRLVYKTFFGELPDDEVVHHKDGNHYNNTPENLQRMTKAEHSRLHKPDFLTEAAQLKSVATMTRMRGDGLINYKLGEDSPKWISLSKIQMLRMLSKVGGQVSKIARSGTMDFETFKRKAELAGIDLKLVKSRYDVRGRYVTRGRMKRVCREGIAAVKKQFGYNHYKAYEVTAERGFKIKSKIPPRANSLNNHRILKVEKLPGKVDVYDISVQGDHNFIANELCVHNCSLPNWQNQPTRDQEIADAIRRCYIPRKGCDFAEVDYGQIEVRVSCAYHQDPALVNYVLDKNTDMHRDAACDLFLLKKSEVSKKGTRDAAKNQFVFPEFYGGKWFDIAPAVWEMMLRRKFTIEGTDRLVVDHLAAKGITALGNCDPQGRPGPGTFANHVKTAEAKLWQRFNVYDQWKRDFFASFLRKGCFQTHSGFRIGPFGSKGVMGRNDVCNYGIQGDSFHCLLWSLIRIGRKVKKYKMKTRVVGEIHDSFQADVATRERTAFLDMAVEVMTKELPKAWRWINVPLDVEAEVAPEGFSWYDKVEYVRSDAGWSPKDVVKFAERFKRPFIG